MSSYGVNPWAEHRKYIENTEDAVLYVRGDYCHVPASQIPKRFKHLPTEAIVRNPWDRTVSRYYYLSKMNNFDISFEKFVKTKYVHPMYAQDPDYAKWGSVSWTQQVEWLNEDTNVHKFEEYNFSLHENKSNNQNFREMYTNQLYNIVGDYYNNDIERFNYV
jgi:hypothetical protein